MLQLPKPSRHYLGAALLGLLLAGCGGDRQDSASLDPVTFRDGDGCHVCGMIIGEFPGPKGEAVSPGAVRKFCSTAELLGWWLQPENRRDDARLYVHDMAHGDWSHPDDTHLIDATTAYYVVGIQRPGAMGATLASFAEQADAERLAHEEGGRVLRFAEIDQGVLQGVGDDHAHRHGHAGKAP
ncbi:nitrous oxide reductase accessory protein NosL [Zestomonas carbonaria]|uniref:Copper-binding lipoprotein NosL n=1 Tax=Zestomonas carbonaria TaxID=2762745 RepID=A0A7U7EMG7_9GAMM|nr:nitrous oxide reductase accessory protein NosL [Pseudomonas carbonaria]CAD5107152.1 Copper-binding lipoprotein NosL [Pseudomonas carbonaria]